MKPKIQRNAFSCLRNIFTQKILIIEISRNLIILHALSELWHQLTVTHFSLDKMYSKYKVHFTFYSFSKTLVLQKGWLISSNLDLYITVSRHYSSGYSCTACTLQNCKCWYDTLAFIHYLYEVFLLNLSYYFTVLLFKIFSLWKRSDKYHNCVQCCTRLLPQLARLLLYPYLKMTSDSLCQFLK